MHLIETRDLCYSYPHSVQALDHVNFIAPRNARVAVIGANGAGKSTLFRHFNGIFRPTSGEVLVKGERITRDNIREVRKTVGIVFQHADDQIFSPTVAQDVAFGPVNIGLDPEMVHHRVDEALRMVGLEDIAGRVPHHLSGGEKKRVAIAGIVAMEPQVMVLDEPTAGLDPQGVRDLIGIVNRLTREYGITIIFSTHEVSLIPEIADYIYVMHKGAIVAEGSIREVFAQPDLLRSVRLDVPLIPRLIRSLQEHGVDITMAYTLEEAEKTFLDAYSRKP